ncbi:MAG: hypothetical protein NZM31_01630 [Gemmatales bacterium]|nr:hypothetical protein [Gemmatales bacterium]MDW8385698.1 hypothetical protein [Gemmatales bacterium]
MPDNVAPPEPNPVAESEASLEVLEQRLQRLEDIVAALCDLQGMEDRLYERLVERFKKKTQIADGPPTATVVPNSSATSTGDDSAKAGWTIFGQMEAATALGEIWQDLRLMWKMMRDPFYSIPWLTRLVVLLPLVYIAWSTLAGFHNGVLGPILVGYIIDVVLLIPLLYLTFKVWQRELRRYRQVQANYAARR